MKKGHWFAIVSALSLIALALVMIPAQVAQGATGCTCPTGCATRTVQNTPFTLSGVGEYCIESTNLGAYVQSWGTDLVNITGVDYTNKYVVTDQMLRDTTGKYFVYYKSTTGNGNFSTNGTSTITNCTMAWCSDAQFGQMDFPPFTMYNNVWGATTGTGQTIQSNGPSQWRTFTTFPETGGVKSYPNASLDMNGKTISTLGSCTSSFNVTVPATGSWEVAYDIWVPSEIMIWMNKNGLVGPIAQGWNNDGTPIPSATNVSLSGAVWDVYHGGSNVISFVRQGNVTSANLDIMPFLTWSASQGWISNTSNLGKFQFGFEITSAPGGLNFINNSYSMSCGGRGGNVTPVPSLTPTRTNTPGGPTVTPTRTPTRTNTPAGPTLTPTRTLGASPTRTNTPVGPTATPTRTPTRTNTPVTTGGACSPVTSTITAPFTFDGTGTLCWQSSNLGTYINSWNTASVTLNGTNVTNLYVAAGSYPAKINGFWYVSYASSVAWGHFEAK